MYVSSTSGESCPVKKSIIPCKSTGAINCPLFLENIATPFFTVANRFWPSVFSVATSSKFSSPWRPEVTIFLKSPNVNLVYNCEIWKGLEKYLKIY